MQIYELNKKIFSLKSLSFEWASLVAQMVKNLPAMQKTQVWSGLERSPAEGNGHPFQYSCLENPMDRGAWWAIVYGIAQIWTYWETNTFTLKLWVICYAATDNQYTLYLSGHRWQMLWLSYSSILYYIYHRAWNIVGAQNICVDLKPSHFLIPVKHNQYNHGSYTWDGENVSFLQDAIRYYHTP